VDKIVILKHSETKWRTRSIDKISEVISLFAWVQSNSVDIEDSCQSKLYRSVILCAVFNKKYRHKCFIKANEAGAGINHCAKN